SCTSIGSGTPGGIFMPIIAISALSGSLFASLAGHIGLASSLTPVIIICAMAGGLTACVKAPVTSIVLVIEMTSSFLHILPVAICTFIALFLSDLLHTAPIYEAFLNRYIHKNGYTTTCDKCGEIIEQVVEYGSKVVNKHIKEITWPKGALIVGLSRGDDEIIPDGNTLILPGDYLLIMLPRGRSNEIKRTLRQFCVTK
ncbi:MAG TPA: sodium:proton antiporter, partial [Ruminococcaceae bacterium]|nr:sodium:proton antiporter [Oscillospiraceae bacterium]